MTSHAHYATKPKTKLTAHQLDILRLIIKGNGTTGKPLVDAIDLDQLIERTARLTSTKQSMQFTIRGLIINGMIIKTDPIKRRGRVRAAYVATELGRAIGADRVPTPAYIETEEESAVNAVAEGLRQSGGFFPIPGAGSRPLK